MRLSELRKYQQAVSKDAKEQGSSSRKRKLWDEVNLTKLVDLSSRYYTSCIATKLGYSVSSVRKIAKLKGIKLLRER
ncbi:MAG: hypothetical protein V3S69_00045 [Dehalococcoidales bacterium]